MKPKMIWRGFPYKTLYNNINLKYYNQKSNKINNKIYYNSLII